MAGRLLREEVPLTVWNRTKEKAAGLAARWTDSSRALVHEVLAAGAGNSGLLRARTAKIAGEEFSPHFSCEGIAKDFAYLDELAKDLRAHISVAPAVRDLFASVIAAGNGDRDFSSVYGLMRSS